MSLKTERELAPSSRELLSRAKAAAQARNYDYAVSLLQGVLKAEPLFLDGRRLLRAAEIQKFRGLKSLEKQMLGMKVASAAMKLSAVAKKEPAERLVAAEEVLALDPFHVKANTLVAEAGEALGQPEFKAFAYETLASAEKPDKATLNTLANVYMELKEPEKAEKTFMRILEMDPRDGDALSGLKNASAAHASRSGGWETASDYRGVLKNKTEAAQLEQAAKVVKSDEAIDEQIQVNYAKHQEQPNNPLHARSIAQLYVQKGELASGIQWYEYAFKVGGGIDSAIEKTIGDLKLKLTEQELQQLLTDQEQQADPEVRAQYDAAIAAKRTEIDEVRLEQAEARVRAQPNDGQFHFDLGVALFKIGEARQDAAQFKRALQEFQIGQKQPSVRYQAINFMGQCYMNLRMNDFAVRAFSLAESELLGMDELKKEIVYNLGLAYEATAQPEKSLEQWKKIYEHDMSYRDVAQRVEASYGQ